MKTEKNKIEEYFEWWLNDMVTAGYVKSYSRESEIITVAETSVYGRIKRFKRKPKQIEEFNLFPKIDYTYDYKIVWDISAEFLFFEVIDDHRVFQFGKPLFVAHEISLEYVSYVDVKPTTSAMHKGARVSTSYSFPLKKRMIWDYHEIYINKVVPIPMAGTGYKSALFCKSFTPVRFLMTDGGKQSRKIKWEIVMLKQYVKNRAATINYQMKTSYEGNRDNDDS